MKIIHTPLIVITMHLFVKITQLLLFVTGY